MSEPVSNADELDRLRADLAKANADRDAARLEIVDALNEMYTSAGLRRELVRRGWWEWSKEVRP